MNVASLELCRELYELSGWEPSTGKWWDVRNKVALEVRTNAFWPPAYTLGYLLRKLPRTVGGGDLQLWPTFNGRWVIAYVGGDGEIELHANADTPEDTTAKLCIELFKQGILTR